MLIHMFLPQVQEIYVDEVEASLGKRRSRFVACALAA